MVTGLKGPF